LTNNIAACCMKRLTMWYCIHNSPLAAPVLGLFSLELWN
jgi:hypothetical protein